MFDLIQSSRVRVLAKSLVFSTDLFTSGETTVLNSIFVSPARFHFSSVFNTFPAPLFLFFWEPVGVVLSVNPLFHNAIFWTNQNSFMSLNNPTAMLETKISK